MRTDLICRLTVLPSLLLVVFCQDTSRLYAPDGNSARCFAFATGTAPSSTSFLDTVNFTRQLEIGVGQAAYLIGLVSPPDAAVAGSWSFGDSESSSDRIVAHAYSTVSTYTATFTVTDALGGTTSDFCRIKVVPQAVVPVVFGLTSLGVSNGTLTPAFDPTVENYSLAVANDIGAVTVTPTASHADAGIRVNDLDAVSGTPSPAVSLSVGSNTVALRVTSASGAQSRTYSIVVNRSAPEASSDAGLSALAVSSGTLAPGFSASTYTYAVNLPSDVTSIRMTPTPSHPAATVAVNGYGVIPGQQSQSIPLQVGAVNNVSVVVTAEDAVTTRNYMVSVSRAASSDARLSSLSLSAGSLAPPFAGDVTEYSCTVPNVSTNTTITATAVHPGARIRVQGSLVSAGTASNPIPLVVGANPPITVEVTAEDGSSVRVYQLSVTRQSATSGPTYTLTIEVNIPAGGTVTPSSGLAYAANSQVTVTATPATGYSFTNWSGASTAGTAQITLTVDANKSLTANFVRNRYTLTTSGDGACTVTPSSPTIVDHGVATSISCSPHAGRQFSHWTGVGGTAAVSDSSRAVTTVVLTSGDAAVRALTVAKQYQLTVANDGNGTSSPSGVTMVSHGIAQNISCAPNAGYNFGNWSVQSGRATIANATSQSTSVTLDSAAATIRANFVRKQYSLTISTANCTVSPSGTITVNHGQPVTITATASGGYTFSGWAATTGEASFSAASSPTTSVTLTNGNATIVAQAGQIAHQLTMLARDGNGSGSTVPTQGSTQNVAQGVPYTINAVPDADSRFVDWDSISGMVSIANRTSPTTTVTLSGPAAIRATFDKKTYSFAVTRVTNPVGADSAAGGTVSILPLPVGGTYVHGTAVTLTANTVAGHTFTGWGGDASGSTSSTTLTITKNTTVTATWGANAYTLTVYRYWNPSPHTTAQTAYHGVPCAITAQTCASGCPPVSATFYQWRDRSPYAGGNAATVNAPSVPNTSVTLRNGNASVVECWRLAGSTQNNWADECPMTIARPSKGAVLDTVWLRVGVPSPITAATVCTPTCPTASSWRKWTRLRGPAVTFADSSRTSTTATLVAPSWTTIQTAECWYFGYPTSAIVCHEP